MMEVTRHNSRVDILVLGRLLINPENGFLPFWREYRATTFGDDEAGRKKKSEAKRKLRAMANMWLLSGEEKKRRGLVGGNGDRNSRGKYFYGALRQGRILNASDLDGLIAQGHRDSQRGIRANHHQTPPPRAVVTPTPRQGAAEEGESQATGPSTSAGNGAQPNHPPATRDLRERLSHRNAPLILPRDRSQSREGRTSSRGPPSNRLQSVAESGTQFINRISNAQHQNQTNNQPIPSRSIIEWSTQPGNQNGRGIQGQRGPQGGRGRGRGNGVNIQPNGGGDSSRGNPGGATTPAQFEDLEEGEIMETESSTNHSNNNIAQSNQTNPNLAQNNPNLTQNNRRINPRDNSITGRRGQGENRPHPSTSNHHQTAQTTVVALEDIPLPPPQGAGAAAAGGEIPGPNPPQLEDEPDKVIITRQDGLKLEGDNLTEVRDGLQAKVMEDQDQGQRYLSFKEWKRTKGRLEVVPEDGPDQADGTPLTARMCGDALIRIARTFQPRLFDQDHGWRTAQLRANWSSQLPRVALLSIRYPGSVADPRALIESRVRGIGAANSLTPEVRSEFRYVHSHETTSNNERGTTNTDTIVRFEASERAALELQQVIGRRGGTIRAGATHVTLQHNRRDVTAEMELTFTSQG